MLLLSDQLAATETFEDSKEQIAQLVHRFRRKYGGDLEELTDIANLQHAKLWRIYREEPHRVSKVRFSACLNRWVWHGLLDVRRREAKRHAKHPQCPLPEEGLPAAIVSDFDVADFLDGLSADARLVVRMVLKPNDELRAACEERGGGRAHLRGAIRRMLTHREPCGWCDRDGCEEVRPGHFKQCPYCEGTLWTGRWMWTSARVTKAFDEVRAALV